MVQWDAENQCLQHLCKVQNLVIEKKGGWNHNLQVSINLGPAFHLRDLRPQLFYICFNYCEINKDLLIHCLEID